MEELDFYFSPKKSELSPYPKFLMREYMKKFLGLYLKKEI